MGCSIFHEIYHTFGDYSRADDFDVSDVFTDVKPFVFTSNQKPVVGD